MYPCFLLFHRTDRSETNQINSGLVYFRFLFWKSYMGYIVYGYRAWNHAFIYEIKMQQSPCCNSSKIVLSTRRRKSYSLWAPPNNCSRKSRENVLLVHTISAPWSYSILRWIQIFKILPLQMLFSILGKPQFKGTREKEKDCSVIQVAHFNLMVKRECKPSGLKLLLGHCTLWRWGGFQ